MCVCLCIKINRKEAGQILVRFIISTRLLQEHSALLEPLLIVFRGLIKYKKIQKTLKHQKTFVRSRRCYLTK